MTGARRRVHHKHLVAGMDKASASLCEQNVACRRDMKESVGTGPFLQQSVVHRQGSLWTVG